MLRILNRTSTFAVFETILQNEKIETLDDIQRELELKWGFQRQIHDIRNMMSHLNRIGVLEQLQFDPLVYRIHPISKMALRTAQEGIDSNLAIYNLNEFIEFLSQNGLMVRPFLKAIREYPNSLGAIIQSVRDFSKEEGVYNLTVDGPSISAMRNFFQLFKLVKRRDSPGKYELTTMGEKIIGEKSKIKRVRCSREFCREICPANAIHLNYIVGCVGCALCIKACPYGAITFNPDNPTKPFFDEKICLLEKGERRIASPVQTNYIISEEKIMQNWVKAVFKLTNLNVEIPGIGSYPDVVIEDVPTFIECKNKPIRTENRIDGLIKQLVRYSCKEAINSTIERVKGLGIKMRIPELFLIITPPDSNVELLMKKSKEEIDIPTSFLSTTTVNRIGRFLTEGNNIEGISILNAIEPYNNSSKVIINLLEKINS